MQLDTVVFAKLRRCWHTLSAKSGGFGRLENTSPPLETSWSVRKRAGQPRAHSGTRPNRESAGLVFSLSRRFAVSSFRPPASASDVQIRKATTNRIPDLAFDVIHITRTVDQHNAI